MEIESSEINSPSEPVSSSWLISLPPPPPPPPLSLSLSSSSFSFSSFPTSLSLLPTTPSSPPPPAPNSFYHSISPLSLSPPSSFLLRSPQHGVQLQQNYEDMKAEMPWLQLEDENLDILAKNVPKSKPRESKISATDGEPVIMLVSVCVCVCIRKKRKEYS